MFLTSSELILLHWNNLSSDASVQLPLFQSKYFLDASRFQIAPDHQLFVQYILLYTFPSIGKLGLYLPSSFTELLQSLSFNHFLFGNCVYRERQSLIFFVTQYCLYYSSLIFPDAAQLCEKVYYFNKNKFSLCLINFSSLSDNSH